MALPGVALCRFTQHNHPHYFVVCLPTGFLLLARHAEALARVRGGGLLTRRFFVLPLACAAFGAVFLFCMWQDMLIEKGFPDGNYGTAYRFLDDPNALRVESLEHYTATEAMLP